MMTLPLQAEELIPHRKPMRLVEQLLDVDGKDGTVLAQIPVDCPLLAAMGELEDVALVELIAQSYAALKGYFDRLEEQPVRLGFLVGIKQLNWFDKVHAEEPLLVKIRTLAEVEGYAIAEGEVWRREKRVAAGEIKLWIE